MGHVVERVIMGQVFHRVLRFSRVIPPGLRTDFRLHVAVTRKTKGAKWWNCPKALLFRKAGALGEKTLLHFFCL